MRRGDQNKKMSKNWILLFLEIHSFPVNSAISREAREIKNPLSLTERAEFVETTLNKKIDKSRVLPFQGIYSFPVNSAISSAASEKKSFVSRRVRRDDLLIEECAKKKRVAGCWVQATVHKAKNSRRIYGFIL